MRLFGLRTSLLALFLPLVAQCTTPSQPRLCPEALAGATPCRPLRAGMIKLDPELDAIKPIAPYDASGWVMASDLLIGAINDKWVAAVSTKTKRVVWWLETKESLSTPIASFGSWVVFGQRDGTVTKVDSLTGKVAWEAKLGRFALAPFVVNGNTLLALTAGQQLFALDFQTGATSWVYDGASSGASVVIRNLSAPVVHDKKVYFGNASGELHAVNLEDGVQQWKLNPHISEARFSDVVGDIVVDPQRVVIARYDGLVAAIGNEGLDRRILWKEDFPGVTTATFRDGVLYISTLSGDVAALDVNTGRKIWQTTMGQGAGSITVGEKVVYAAGTSGRVAAFDKSNGELLWIDDVEGIISRAPVLFNDRIYFATGLKVLYGYKLM